MRAEIGCSKKMLLVKICRLTESQTFRLSGPLQAIVSMLKIRTEVEICRRRVVGIVVEPHRQASLVRERAKIVAHDDDAPNEGCDGFLDCV